MFFTSNGELSFTNPDNDDALTSAVLISLFSWKDQWYIRSMGTVLFKAFRMSMTGDNLRELEHSARQALQWLITDEIALSYVVNINYDQSQGTASINIIINFPDNTTKLVEFNL